MASLQTLLAAGASRDVMPGPAYFAAKAGHAHIVAFLAKDGADLSELVDGVSPLFLLPAAEHRLADHHKWRKRDAGRREYSTGEPEPPGSVRAETFGHYGEP